MLLIRPSPAQSGLFAGAVRGGPGLSGSVLGGPGLGPGRSGLNPGPVRAGPARSVANPAQSCPVRPDDDKFRASRQFYVIFARLHPDYRFYDPG